MEKKNQFKLKRKMDFAFTMDENNHYKSASLLLTKDNNLILSVREGDKGDGENAKKINILLTDAILYKLETALQYYKRIRGEDWND